MIQDDTHTINSELYHLSSNIYHLTFIIDDDGSEVKIPARKIYTNLAPLLKRSGKRVIYISTDEGNRGFFKPFEEAGYELRWMGITIKY